MKNAFQTFLFIFGFGLITITNGKPSHSRDSHLGNDKKQLQNLLNKLSNQRGNFNIELSHHVDGPKSHHEDRALISPHYSSQYNSRNNPHAHHHHHGSHNNENNPSLTNIQTVNLLARKKFKNIARTGDSDDDETNNIMARETERMCPIKNKKQYNCTPPPAEKKWKRIGDENENENIDEVLQFLNNLDKKIEDEGYNADVRCTGNNMCEGRNPSHVDEAAVIEDNANIDRDNLRCSGNNCARNIDDSLESRDKNGNRCSGDRCERNRDDSYHRHDAEDRDDLRCREKACGRSINTSRNGRNGEIDQASGQRYPDLKAAMVNTTMDIFLKKFHLKSSDIIYGLGHGK